MAKKYIDADRLKQTIADNVYPVQDAFNSRDYGMFWTGGIEKAIDEAPAADIPRWIPVKERLPEAYGRYLVALEDEDYISVMPLYYGRINRIDTFYDSDSEYGDIEYCGVIAWMPLPSPYKEGEQNE